jgi:hypothetical protein
MKHLKTLILLTLYIALSYQAYASAKQGNWRWRNDDGNEITATWKADEKTAFLLTNTDNIRLRVVVYNDQGSASYDFLPGLAYSTDQINYTVITDNATTNHFVFSTSPHLNDGMATTQQLTGHLSSNIFMNGFYYASYGSLNNFILNANSSSEFEYCIKATENALEETTYYFKVVSPDKTNDEIDFEMNSYDSPLPSLYFLSCRVYNSSKDLCYDAIQEAIDNADATDVILIQSGTYNETVVTIPGKGVVLKTETSSGIITINGSLTLHEYDVLDMGLSANDYARLDVQGLLTLGNSKFNISPSDDYLHIPGTLFELIGYGNLSGEFSNQNLVSSSNNDPLIIDYENNNHIVLTAVRQLFKMGIGIPAQ